MKEQLIEEIARLRQEVDKLRQEKPERKRAGERIQHLNLVLHAIRDVNQLIAREKDRSRLLKGICDSLTESHGYYNAWVALLDESGRLIAHAESGLGADFLPMKERLVRGELTHCAQKALKQSGPVITENPPLSCSDCPLSAKYSGREGMTIGLQHNGKSYGILSISVPADLVGEEEECLFFQEVASDIAFALHDLELEERHAQSEHNVRERVKELECLYGIAAIAEKSEITLDELYQEVANLLPSSWQYPEICCARITIEDREFRTANYRDAKWKLCSDIKAGGVKAGAVEVNYLEERPELDEGPFLREERRLIDAVAERVGRIAEQKKAEEELKESESRYRLLLESITDGVFVIDHEWQYLMANDEAARMVQMPKEKLLGSKMTDLFPGIEATVFFKTYNKVMETGESAVASDEFVFEDGQRGWYEVHVYPVPEGLLVIVADITERKKAEAQIRELSSVVEQSIDGIAIGNLEPKLTYVNDAFARMHGYSPAEMVGMRHTNLHGEEQTDEFEKAIDHIKTKGLWTGEIGHVRKDGTPFPTQMSVTLLTDAQGKPTGIATVCSDITERKQHEKEYKQLIDGMNDTIFVIDFKEKFLDVNDTAIKTLGYSRTELLTMGPVDIDPYLSPDDIGKLIEGMKLDERQVFESQHRTKDGKIIPVEISSSPVSYQGKAAILSVARDITARKQAEETLKESEEKFRTFMETATDFMSISDRAGNLTDVNAAMVRVLGYSQKELIGMHITQLLTKESLERDFKPNWERFAKRGEINLDTTFATKDGKKIYGELKAVAVYDSDGKHAGGRTVFHDLTERKQAQEKLQKSEERYRSLFENATDGIFTMDSQTRFTSGNRKAEEMCGYSKDELIGEYATLILPEEEIPRMVDALKKVLRGEIDTYETRIITKNGELLPVEVTSSPIEIDGKIIGTMGMVRDITERKRAEEKLKESEEKFRTFVDTASDLMSIVDSAGNFTDVNAAMARVLGYSKKELIGMHITQLLTKEALERDFKPNWERFTKRGGISLDTTFATKDGKEIYGELKAVAVYDSDGKNAGSRAVFHDLTERKLAEQASEEARTRFEDLFETANELIITTDAEGWVLRLNKEVEELSGYSKKELTGQSILKIAYPEDNAKYIQFWQDILSGLSPHYELRTISKTGVVSNLLASGNAIRKDGNIVEIQYNAKDITTEKQAEEALRESEEKYRQLTEEINDAIYTTDRDGNLTYVSPVIEWLTGYSPSEIMGRSFAEFLHEEDLPRATDDFKRALSGHSTKFEYRFYTKSGEIHWLGTSNRAIFAGDDVVGVQGVLTDITERKLAEQASEEARTRFEDLFETANELIITTDTGGWILHVNKEVERFSGYSKKELIGQSILKIAYPEDVPKYIQFWKDILDGLTPRYHLKGFSKTGNISHLLASASVVKKDGNIVEIQYNAKDITEEKQAEEKLRESEGKYRAILGNIEDGYFEVDLAGNFTFGNDSLCKIIGYPPDEIVSMNNRQYMDKENAKKVFQTFNKVYTTGKFDKAFDWELIRKDGTKRIVEASVSLIRNPQGEPTGFRGIARDITERKEMEAERKMLEQRAQLTSRLSTVGEMASGIVHEINNPLTSVIGFAQLLAQQDLPEDAREYARIINNEGQRVASIAGRILDFARHEKPERVYADINQLIESTLELQAYEMEAANIRVTTQLAPDLPRTTADVGQLQQVFLNIILNAKTEMQSAHGKGKFLVKTESIDNTIRISFEDNGPGIARENLERIFEPFFTTKEVGTATGLGLSICHEIIANHNGQIYAESTLGKGATFTIKLPVVARQRKTATTARANASTV